MANPKISGRASPAKRIKLAELRREINYSEHTKTKAKKEWRQLCLNIALPKLREELLNCWHYFEKLIDTKDFVISLCMDELQKHEDLYKRNLQNHQSNLEYLMNSFSQNLRDIHAKNNELLMIFIRNALEDWESEIYRASISENYVKVVRFGLEVLRKRWVKTAKTDSFARKNEELSKVTHETQHITFVLELKLEDLWNRIQKTDFDYWQRIQENKKHHETIRETDEINTRTVKKELKKLMNLQVLAKRLATKFKQLVSTIGEKLTYLEGEKESLHELQFALRNKLMQNKDIDALKRTVMSIEFIKVYDNLNVKLKKGESMMKVLKGMRRYEISREKILPYPVGECDQKENDEFCLPQLRLFWQKVAQADVYRYTLNEERTYLKAENKKLRQKIHAYCKCFKCPALPPIPQRAGKIPYTEGREMMQKLNTHKKKRN